MLVSFPVDFLMSFETTNMQEKRGKVRERRLRDETRERRKAANLPSNSGLIGTGDTARDEN